MSSGNGNGNLPAKTPTDEERRSVARKQKRDERYRKKLAKLAWNGTGVHICKGPGKCFWADPVTFEGSGNLDPVGGKCTCKEGWPCECEKKILRSVIKAGEEEHGLIASRMLGAAMLDILRQERRGNDDGIRDARLKILDLLLRAESERRKLDIRERKLAMDESSARPSGPTIVEYIRQRADAEDTDDTEESAS